MAATPSRESRTSADEASRRLLADLEEAMARADAAKEDVRTAKAALKRARKLSKLAKRAAKRARKRLEAARKPEPTKTSASAAEGQRPAGKAGVGNTPKAGKATDRRLPAKGTPPAKPGAAPKSKLAANASAADVAKSVIGRIAATKRARKAAKPPANPVNPSSIPSSDGASEPAANDVGVEAASSEAPKDPGAG